MNTALLRDCAASLDQAEQFLELASRTMSRVACTLRQQAEAENHHELRLKADQCVAEARLIDRAHDGITCIDSRDLLDIADRTEAQDKQAVPA